MLFSCTQEIDPKFKYTEEKDLFRCSSADDALVKEAVYTFENFIATTYAYKSDYNIKMGYYNYLEKVENNLLPMVEKFDDHMIYIISKLKAQPELWIKNNSRTTVNFNSDLFECIADNIQDEQTKTILQTLVDSNTFKPEIFAPTIESNYNEYDQDRALVAYIALDMFYASVMDLDFSLPRQELAKQVAEINKQRAGHVH